jgi:hypothetical protein
MKQNHYQELEKSVITGDVIQLNLRSSEGYEGFAKFLSLCDSKDTRQGMQICDRQIQNRYSHLYEGYWYAESWCPFTDTKEIKQVKPDYPMLRLKTTKGTGRYKQPISLKHRPDLRISPREKGYLLGDRQTIISMAKALNITQKLPKDEQGNWYLEAISAMSPEQKYQWCLDNEVFDHFAFETIKYETPSGSGTPFIYLDIPVRIIKKIADNYQINLPENYKTWNVGDKWRWIRKHPQIPLFITEGIKKAAALISQEQIAIASFSITTHSEKTKKGESSWLTNLKPELLWLLEKKTERQIYVVFDAADVKKSSRQAVKRETKKIAKKLKKYGTVKVISWDDKTCKGIDDFIAKHGKKGLNEIIESAVDFKKIWQKEIANYGYKLSSNIKVKQQHLSPNIINKARLDGVKLLLIKSHQNTGKTSAYAKSLEQYEDVYNGVKLRDINSDKKTDNCSISSTCLEQDKYYSSSLSLDQDKELNNIVKSRDINSHQNHEKTGHYAQSLEKKEDIKNSKEVLYKIGEKVKIRVSTEIFDSQIIGYNPFDENPYICEFAQGFFKKKAEQIISNSHQKSLPEKLITYGLTHRQSLAWNLANRFHLDCYLDKMIPIQSKGIMVTADSSLLISEYKQFTDMVIDEGEQVAWHTLASLTDIRKNRISKIGRIIYHGNQIINNNGMITIMDADLSDFGVKLYQMLFDIKDEDTLVIENTYKPFEGLRDCFIYDNVESLRNSIIESIRKGEKIIIHTSGQKESSTHGTINIEKEIIRLFPELKSKIYRIDKESLGDSNHHSYQILSNLKRLKQAQIIIASSSINTGVSLEENIVGKIDQVFGIFYGNYPLTDFEQAIERYRGHCDRHIYIKNASSERINIGSYKYSDLLQNITGQSNNIHKLLQDDFSCDLAFDLVKFYSKFAARINNDYIHLKDNFISHLENKGYTICQGKKLNTNDYKQMKDTYQHIKDESEREFQDKTYQMETPNDKRQLQLEKAKTKSKLENIEEYKGKLAKRYKTEKITRELIALDREGFYPQLQLRFWLMFGQSEAIKRDKRVLTKYAQNNEGKGYAIDFNRNSKSTQVAVLKHIGLLNSLDSIANLQTQEILIMLLSMQFNPLWFKVINIKRLTGLITESDIIPYLSWRDDELVKPAFKQVLNIDLDKNHSPMQLLRMIFKRIGYGIAYVARYGPKNNRKRFYKLTDCISTELWDNIFAHWVEHELGENLHAED